jgi:hypothetical protein
MRRAQVIVGERLRVETAEGSIHGAARSLLEPLTNSVARRESFRRVEGLSAKIFFTVCEHALGAVGTRGFRHEGAAQLRLEARREEALAGFDLSLLVCHYGQQEW